jgi:hypothetical protein
MGSRPALKEPQSFAVQPNAEVLAYPGEREYFEDRSRLGNPPNLGKRPGLRATLSRLRASLMTVLGWPMGFFIQYPYARSLQPVEEPYPEVEALCAASPFRDFLGEIRRWRPEMAGFGDSPSDPVFGRGMFSALDGVAAYAAVRRFRPRRVIEIGSGDSTYFLARGVRDNGVGTVTCIDPRPRREIAHLGVAFEQRMLINADADMAGELDANDILFIDSSHIMLPGMDVDIQFNRMFPRLKRGVIVHLHDIFLPDNYPSHWRVRNYSEQNALVGWLLGSAFEIIWPAGYVYSRHRRLIDNALGEIGDNAGGGSLWLRKT